ncbi:hypothetical protein HPP92_027068 [Vanilla planifolia]|uniref:Autophagy-related protein 13 N-terminal domain-containing protein n=1 Tax=Vanilla planifolia TaxID=51239 RepID=A0A835PEN1_VANPL|nr:hypothetical protein HPP92_027068 [Vanilla planifolia]
MASSPSSSISEPAIVEQVITEFFAKSAHIILESRSPYVSSRNYSADPFISSPSSSSSSSSFRPRDKWFNLALKDCPAALENFDLWRQSNLEPLVVDVTLNRRKPVRDRVCSSPCSFLVRNLSSDRDEFVRDNRSEKIVERWIVQYDSQGNSWPVREVQASKKGSRVASHATEFEFMYKKAYGRIIVLLRSLYAAVRLLPAYKLFRDLNASGQIHPLSLSHKISSYFEPFSQDEDAERSQLGFGPLDTFFGKLSVSVNYVKTLVDVSSEPSTPLSTQVIDDYVGSPLTDPLKRFESLPSAGETPFSPTLSPTYSDSRALDCNVISHIPSCSLFPDNPVSPPSIPLQFSRSSSPSPPSHVYKALLCSDSSPVSIPLQGESSGRLSQGIPPSPYSKSKKQGYPSQVGTHETQASKEAVPQASSLENKVQVKKELSGITGLQSNIILPQNNNGPSTGLKNPSANLPHKNSRTSSSLSFTANLDDSDLVCPFAEDAESRNSCRTMDSALIAKPVDLGFSFE